MKPHDKRLRVGLYDAYLATLGGGENLVAVLADCIEREMPEAEIDLITHPSGEVKIDALRERFGVRLERSRIVSIPTRSRNYLKGPLRPLTGFLHEQDIAQASKPYDLFINNTVFSTAPPRSRQSIYMCMFPLDPVPAEQRNWHPSRRLALKPYVLLRRILFRMFIRRYDVVLGISQYTRRWIEKMWGLNSRLLYPPVETQSSLDLSLKRKEILTIGRFFPGSHNKKHDVLIDAFIALRDKGLDDWELHLVGGVTPIPGTARYIESLRARAEGHPIHFHFDISRDDLQSRLQQASIFWHATGYGEEEIVDPYKLEHFGITTVEAMTFGCVPVVYASGGQPEILGGGGSGFLWSHLGSLHEHTLELIGNPTLRLELAKAAHLRSQRYGREVFCREVRALLRELFPTH